MELRDWTESDAPLDWAERCSDHEELGQELLCRVELRYNPYTCRGASHCENLSSRAPLA